MILLPLSQICSSFPLSCIVSSCQLHCPLTLLSVTDLTLLELTLAVTPVFANLTHTLT